MDLLILLIELFLLLKPGLLILEEQVLIHLLQAILPLLLALLLRLAPLLGVIRRAQHFTGPLIAYHLTDRLSCVVALLLYLILEGSDVLGRFLTLLVGKLLAVLEAALVKAVLHHLMLVLPVVLLFQVQDLLSLRLSLVDLFNGFLLLHLKHSHSVSQHHDVLLYLQPQLLGLLIVHLVIVLRAMSLGLVAH